MERTELDRLNGLIDRLDATNAPDLSPLDAESLLGEILQPLLADGGYSIEATGTRRDLGVDFLAKKGTSAETDDDTIAVEYKHFRRGSSVGTSEVFRLLGAATVAGMSRAMLVTNSRFSAAARDAIRRCTPVEIELMNLDALRSWVGRLEEVPSVDIDQINIIRLRLSREFIKLIAKSPRYLDAIEWREMEYLVCEVFEGLGFNAHLTPGSKDGGKDLVLSGRVGNGSHTYYVEVKHWRSGNGVGQALLRDFVNVVVNEEVDGGLFLSSYGYCSNAIETLTEIERRTIRLGSEQKIISLCKSYVKATTGIWTPENLTDVLFENTL